ncbi:sugar phosphate isomerase/epimerase family protein [Streptomyces scopuliridis]|uniref:sugar phosphate isomerase/epimerase family protein n=1 Tax=Streptomyces scopuliridis TaxID=452529 RepID=UPI0036A5AF63
MTSNRPSIPIKVSRVQPGLCSVTLRSQTPDAVVRVATTAGLRSIEWGADTHVPVGDTSRARHVLGLTTDAGLRVASYGSYLHLGFSSRKEHDLVLKTAVALGAPRVRVWAGRCGSADADADQWATVVEDARVFADSAAEVGVQVGLEFHGGTLTDRAESTARLLTDVDRSGLLGTYWQPPYGLTDTEALAGLEMIADHVLAVHAFSWDSTGRRHPLEARQHLWKSALHLLKQAGRSTDVLLEFVLDDSPAQVKHDATALLSLLDATPPSRSPGSDTLVRRWNEQCTSVLSHAEHGMAAGRT